MAGSDFVLYSVKKMSIYLPGPVIYNASLRLYVSIYWGYIQVHYDSSIPPNGRALNRTEWVTKSNELVPLHQ